MNEIINTIFFEKDKTISSTYNIKEFNHTVEIDITTLHIKVTEKEISVIYLVNDSDNKYEYCIVRSE